MKTLLGYMKREYTNKKGVLVRGYEVYFGRSINPDLGKGVFPSLRFIQSKKQFQNWFVSEDVFDKFQGIDKLIGKPVEVYTDPDYGNIVSIIPA